MNTSIDKPVLLQAQELIHGDRQEAYGHPAINLAHIAESWRVYLKQKYGVDLPIVCEDVCWMMVEVKKCRQMSSPKVDNVVDAAGYLGLIERCEELRPEMTRATRPA